MQAFTNIFRSCNLESSLKWACLSAIEEMLVPVSSCFLSSTDLHYLFIYLCSLFMIMPTVIKALHSFRHFGVFFLVWDVFVCVGWVGKVNSFDCSVLGYVFFSFIVYYHLAVS